MHYNHLKDQIVKHYFNEVRGKINNNFNNRFDDIGYPKDWDFIHPR
jgi:hypothetical protein